MVMTRRRFVELSASAAAALPFARLLSFQPQAPAPAFETIRRNVGFFTGKGGTIGWLINPTAVVVVDTQFPDTAKICVDGLAQKSSRGIDLVFNTHHHGDHTGGNGLFKAQAKRLVAHAKVPGLQRQFNGENAPPPVVADVTFESTWSESFGDERITAKHHGPAHTGGDAVIHFERAQVVHMGDLLFHERHPFVDRAAGASMQNWMKVLTTVMKEMPADTVYIAGHSKQGLPVAVDRKALERQVAYFDAVLSHTRKGIAAGQSKEEVTKLAALAGFEEHQEAPPRLTLGSVLGVAYDELTAK